MSSSGDQQNRVSLVVEITATSMSKSPGLQVWQVCDLSSGSELSNRPVVTCGTVPASRHHKPLSQINSASFTAINILFVIFSILIKPDLVGKIEGEGRGGTVCRDFLCDCFSLRITTSE